MVLATGTEYERPLLADWPDSVRQSPRFIDALGVLSLRQLAAVVSQMSAYIVPSTGPLHVASALGTATISPFCSWSNLAPAVWGNQNEGAVNLSPSLITCARWRLSNATCDHCQLHGEVTAEQLADRAIAKLANSLTGRRLS
jgi:hypothetical protein